MSRLIATILVLVALAVGVLFKDDSYRLRAIAQPSDQLVLAHADSPYTSVTWVASPSENYLQLRFFDKVEGGVCLHPSWAELITMSASDARLGHLVPREPRPALSAPAGWPAATPVPDPGTLANSAYVRLFPAGVLLNRRFPEAATAAPRILVVGLGSGVGIACLAHHFPEAAIEVVDIDRTVIDLVVAHYPLLRWLTTQRTAAGLPRLLLVDDDARRHVQLAAPGSYDMVILDAYTAGSTIPPHLMTREFFAECARSLHDDGTLLANIIGSYVGPRHLVLGGAMRAMRAAGLGELINIPVLTFDAPGSIDVRQDRNNIVVCSRRPLDPRGNPAGWERLRAWVPYPELAVGRYLARQYILADRESFKSAFVSAEVIEAQEPTLGSRLQRQPTAPGVAAWQVRWRSDDPALVAAARRAALGAAQADQVPLGWDGQGPTTLWRFDTDWVLAAREVVRVSLIAGRDVNSHGGEALVGPVDPLSSERPAQHPTWVIGDAPLFTDAKPNADILNR